MTIGDKIIEIAKGNPGAAHALSKLVKHNLMTRMFIVSKLDELKIYGTDIYVLFNDICNDNYHLLEYIVKFTEPTKLTTACSKQDRTGMYILKDEMQNYFTRDMEDDVQTATTK